MILKDYESRFENTLERNDWSEFWYNCDLFNRNPDKFAGGEEANIYKRGQYW